MAADLDVAEDCVQDAYAQALVHWRSLGIPRRPGAWLTTVATRRALEHRRRDSVLRRKLPLLVPAAEQDDPTEPDTFPDDRLRLLFTCCHPALPREAQVALTLRLVCGLSSAEIAKAFLVKGATMQARITRAKHKIALAQIPYRVPDAPDLPERVDAVLEVIQLVYASGHTAPFGEELIRPDLMRQGLDLARVTYALLPGDGEAAGLLALLLLTQARADARIDPQGRLVRMRDQDRGRWDRGAIANGLALIPEALAHPPIGRFALMAAAAAVHAEAVRFEDTDWDQLLGIYDLLLARWPSPVVALNRAVVVSYVDGPRAGLEIIAALDAEPGMPTYPYLAATRAELLERIGDDDGAASAYREALLLTENAVEADHLRRRLEELSHAP